jgi:Flp pilus assembly protein TadD
MGESFMAGKSHSSRYRSLSVAILSVAASLALGACKNQTSGLEDDLSTASIGSASIKDTAEAGQKWEADPGNIKLGLNYAHRLKALGQTQRQMMVLETLAAKNPANRELLSVYGKELLLAGQPQRAVPVLTGAISAGAADWRLHSALGSAYDQLGRYSEARAQYDTALTFKPGEISILNNQAMSFALEGNLPKAEAALRAVQAMPNAKAEPRTRQNLALVVGLQGRFDEARKIASQDLPPEQVDANMAYLERMLSQPNTWQQLKTPG